MYVVLTQDSPKATGGVPLCHTMLSLDETKAEMKGCLTHVTSHDLDKVRHVRWQGRGQPKKEKKGLRHV